MHLTSRQYLYDYMIKNRDSFREFLKENVEIDEYISKMLLDGE